MRHKIHALVDEERQHTAAALGTRASEFLALKVEGILECAELLVVALGEGRDSHVFGRRTMPHMDLASVSCAIQNLWLAARAEGLGMGWVSIFDPQRLAELLEMPDGAEPVAVLCLGPVPDFPPIARRWKSTSGRSVAHSPSSSAKTGGVSQDWSADRGATHVGGCIRSPPARAG